ncbi:hypothetical protein [Kribbella sp. NPDC004875]|uniref:hypothetical protein n=1 Tax=Kribbella sp. NPDC004875 TaxID=3364107 RepID=UPI0036BE38D5
MHRAVVAVGRNPQYLLAGVPVCSQRYFSAHAVALPGGRIHTTVNQGVVPEEADLK